MDYGDWVEREGGDFCRQMLLSTVSGLYWINLDRWIDPWSDDTDPRDRNICQVAKQILIYGFGHRNDITEKVLLAGVATYSVLTL